MMAVGTGGIREARIYAKVLDKNGNVKRDLGLVSYWHKNPLKRLWWRIKQWLP